MFGQDGGSRNGGLTGTARRTPFSGAFTVHYTHSRDGVLFDLFFILERDYHVSLLVVRSPVVLARSSAFLILFFAALFVSSMASISTGPNIKD